VIASKGGPRRLIAAGELTNLSKMLALGLTLQRSLSALRWRLHWSQHDPDQL